VTPWTLQGVPDPALVMDNFEEISALDRAHDSHKHRTVMIGQKAVNVMGSATEKYKPWFITWDHGMRWSNGLMGWTSSGDTLR